MSRFSLRSKIAVVTIVTIVTLAITFIAYISIKPGQLGSASALHEGELKEHHNSPAPLPKLAIKPRLNQAIGFKHSYDKYLARLAELSALPKFTAAEVQLFLERRGRDARTLSFAALALRDRKLLEEARSLNPDDIHVIHCHAQFAIDEIRGGNPDALNKVAKLLADNKESESLQMALLYSTWLHEHFVTSKIDPALAPKSLTAKEFLQLMPKTGNYPGEALTYRDLMYDILRNEKGISSEADLILKTYSDPYPLTPPGGGSWLLEKLIAASQDQKDPAEAKALNEFAARQLALITNSREISRDLISKQQLLEQELSFLTKISTTTLNIQPYLNLPLDQYRKELEEDLHQSDQLTTRFFDVIFEGHVDQYPELNPSFNPIESITSRLTETISPHN